jgi:hypothetical protein
VQLSVKGLDVDGWFFDTAICMLYGDFDEETVDNNVEVVDTREVDCITLRDMKRVRRLYYYNRPMFDELMRIGDPDLDCSVDFVEGYDVGDDMYAPGSGRWISDDNGDEGEDFNREGE